MRQLLYTTFAIILAACLPQNLWSQCTPTSCISSLPAYGGICDTLLLDGRVGQSYTDAESFHTTTNCFDAGIIDPANAGTYIRIDYVDNFVFSGLPAGITAATNQPGYTSPANGCIAFSGTPTEAGIFEPTADFLADVTVTSSSCFPFLTQNDNNASYSLDLIILPDPTFTLPMTNFTACDGPASLTATGTTGGTFSGPGVSGSTFDPAIAGVGTHTITYVISAQQGAAVAPAVDSSSVVVTVTNYSVSTTSTDATCSGTDGTATVLASGGVTPYTYSWSSGGSSATETGLATGTYYVTITDNTACSNYDTVTVGATTVTIAGTTSTVDASCGLSDGSATATPSNGTAPYSYSWSPGGQTTQTANNLAAGNYSVIVTDANGCVGTLAATVNNPSPPTASIASSTDVACNGDTNGSATVAASGGTSPYNYNWSAGNQTTATVNGLAAGVYNVTVVDAASCATTTAVTISEPPAVSTSIASSSDVSCNGLSDGSATVTASGGTSPYNYSWSTGGSAATETGLAAGSHTATITDDNGCVAVETATITEPAALSGTPSSSNISCNGADDGSITVSTSGGTSPYSYNWSTGGSTNTISALAVGSYDVTVTDANNCALLLPGLSITEPAVLGATITATEPSSAGNSDGSIDLTPSGGTPPYSYTWNNGAAIQDLSGVPAGTYTVTITDDNGCTFIDSITVADGPSAVSYSKMGTKVTISPNPTPAVAVLHFQSPQAIDAQIQVTNLMGQVLYNLPVYAAMDERLQLDMSSWPAGVYFVRIQIGDELLVQRIVKQ